MEEDNAATPLINAKVDNINHFRSSKWTPIEVMVMLYFMSLISIIPVQQYYVIAVIAEQHNQTGFINQGISHCNISNSGSENNDIEKESSEFLMYLGFCSTFLSVIPIILLGSVAGRFGLKSVIFYCLAGALVKEIIYLLVIRFKLSLYFLYIGQVVEGLTGGFGGMMMALFGMAADVTTPGKNRAFRISVIEGTAAITAAVALSGMGYWIKYGGFYYPMIFICAMTILTALFCLFFIPETSRCQSRTDKFCSSTYLFKCFRLYYYDNPIGRRKKLIVGLFVLGLAGAAILGGSSAQTLFLLHYPLCWKEVHIQIYSSIQTLTNWGAVILIVRILHIFTQDYGILVIGSFSAASSMFLFAFSKKDWLVYLCKLSYYSEYPLPLLVNMFYLWCRLMIWRLSMFFLLAMSFTYDIYSHDSWIKIIVGYQRLITLQCLPLVINETILSYKNHLSGFVP
jgi:MFS family permease